MENALLGNILNNIVMEKAIRDKIVIQQKQQREDEARQKSKQLEDELDQFDDEQTKEIMRKMRNQRMKIAQVEQNRAPQRRVVGEYREDEFLSYVTKLKNTVVHFYHKDFERCKIMDRHLQILSQQFPNTQFLYINAEKTPFFVEKLHIRTLPTLCIFINGVMKDKIIGFQGFSGDQFLTYQLATKLAQSQVIDYNHNQSNAKIILKGQNEQNINDSQLD